MKQSMGNSADSISARAGGSVKVGGKFGLRALLCILAAFNLLSGVMDAQATSNCKGRSDLEHILASQPSAAAYDALGAYFGESKKVSCAISAFRSAVRLDPNLWEAHYDLGVALLTNGNTQEAVRELRIASGLQPKEAQIHAALESALGQLNREKSGHASQELQSGEGHGTVEFYQRLIAKNPKNSRAYYALALALDRQGDSQKEHEVLQKAVELDAKFAPGHNQLGLLSLRAGQLPEAEVQFKTAISLDAKYGEAQNNLGVLYGQMGKNEEAEQMFRQAMETDPHYGQSFVNLGLVLAGESRFTDADQILSHALQLEPDNTSALAARGMVLTRLNRSGEAIEYFRKVSALDPKSPGAHLNLGIALADQLDLREALAEFTEAARLDPNSGVAHYNIGRCLLDLQRSDEAKVELEAATRFDPDLADVWYLLGLIAKDANETQLSVQSFEKAATLNPGNAEAHFMLGQQLLQNGDPAGATSQWRKALEIRPQYSEALYNLSRLLMKSDPEEANQFRARLEDLHRQRHMVDRADMFSNFALQSANAHDWRQAVSQMNEAFEVCGNCSVLPFLHKNLGLIYCRSGELEKGKIELLQAQKMAPDDKDVERALQLLNTP